MAAPAFPKLAFTGWNLLFGLLAVQLGFLDRRTLLAVLNTWRRDKDRSLGDLLAADQLLTPERKQTLDNLARQHVKEHGNDPKRSLAALAVPDNLIEDLLALGDPEIAACLAQAAPTCGSTHEAGRWAVPPASDDPAGAPRFEVLHPHAEGGMGKVSVALDRELRRKVAFKEMKERFASDMECRARFRQEAEITGHLEHPGVVPVYGLGQYPDGRPFYAMRFVQGESFRDAVLAFHAADQTRRDAGERTLALRQLLGRFLAVCNVLAYAHSRGIIHRDLKPANILLGKYGETFVVDWGLAKAVGRPESAKLPDLSTLGVGGTDLELTRPGQTLGTPAYMSPEQALGLEADPRSDIYGLGATLYTLLTGLAPYEGEGREMVLEKLRKQVPPAPPRRVCGRVPPALEAVCLKAMAMRPEDRYARVEDLAADVEHWLADEPVSAWVEPFTARMRRLLVRHSTPVLAGAAAALVVALVLVVTTGVLVAARRSEANARKAAEMAAQEAEDLRAEAEKQRAEADRQRDQARRQKDELGRAWGKLANLLNEVAGSAVAISYYEKALAVFEQLDRDDPGDPNARDFLAVTHGNLANAYSAVGRKADAEQSYRKAQGIWEQLVKDHPHNLLYKKHLASNFHNQGNRYREKNDIVRAEKSFEEARRLLDEVCRADPSDTDTSNRKAQTLGSLANTYGDHGRVPAAEAAYAESIRILERLAEEQPRDTDVRREIAVNLNNRAILFRQTGREEQALRDYEKSLGIRRQLVKAEPQNRTFQSDLAGGLNNLGLLNFERGNVETAHKRLDEAVTLWEGLVNRHPREVRYAVGLGQAAGNLGNLYCEQGDYKAALASYERAGSALLKAAKADPQNDDARLALRNLLAGQARVYNRLGRYDDAWQNWDRVETLDRDGRHYSLLSGRAWTLALQGKHLEAARIAQTLLKYNLSGSLHYEVACTFSLAAAAVSKDAALPLADRGMTSRRYLTRAIECLEDANKQGYFRNPLRREKLRTDPDLDAVRRNPQFKALLELVEGKAG